MSAVPASRSLEAVLREALREPGTALRVIAGTYDTTPSADARYANVVVNGQHLTIPNLNAQPPGAAGELVYILADRAHMWVMGTMSSSINYGIAASGQSTAAFSAAPSSGVVTVTHGLGVVPRAVFLQAGVNALGSSAIVAALTATTFNWQAFTSSGGNYTGNVTYYWIAVG